MRKIIISGLLIISLFAVSGCTDEAFNVSDVKLCLMTVDGICDLDAVSFARETDEIFSSAVLNNAPTDTKVDFQWFYVDGQQVIDTVTLNAEKAGNSSLRSSLPKPAFEGGWPLGKYQLRISVQGHPEIKTIVKTFSIQ
jgi:hypothetical protein